MKFWELLSYTEMAMTLRERIWEIEDKWREHSQKGNEGGSTEVAAISTEKQDMTPSLTHLVVSQKAIHLK